MDAISLKIYPMGRRGSPFATLKWTIWTTIAAKRVTGPLAYTYPKVLITAHCYRFGDVWSDVTLTVQLPASVEEGKATEMIAPSFVKPLEECIAEEGETAEFECIVAGE